MKEESLTYKAAGVDQDKAGRILGSFGDYLKTRPRDPSLLSGIGPFASCYSLKTLLGQYTDPVLVTCCDGVGTKAKLALDWGKIDTLGEDLVAMNVNDLLCVGAKPILFLDYYACGKLDETQLLQLLKSIQHGCELSGSSLAGGETAEMPGVYAGEDFDLAGFSTGVVERESILGAHRVKEGDILIGLASSGFHSNGYSLVRKIVEREKLSPEAPSPWGHSWRDQLLAPTTIYVPMLKNVLPRLRALAHLTGGGLFENLPRVLPTGVRAEISAAQWKIPPMFRWFGDKAGLSTEELLTTFNCGIGMIAVCDRETAKKMPTDLKALGVEAWEIGAIRADTPGAPPRVTWQ